jgi:hypothetical protein
MLCGRFFSSGQSQRRDVKILVGGVDDFRAVDFQSRASAQEQDEAADVCLATDKEIRFRLPKGTSQKALVAG